MPWIPQTFHNYNRTRQKCQSSKKNKRVTACAVTRLDQNKIICYAQNWPESVYYNNILLPIVIIIIVTIIIVIIMLCDSNGRSRVAVSSAVHIHNRVDKYLPTWVDFTRLHNIMRTVILYMHIIIFCLTAIHRIGVYII